MKTILHIGCGTQSTEALPPLDFDTEWQEVRLDIDPAVKPDIVDSIVTLEKVADRSVDIVFSKHCLEHLEYHEVAICLGNICRVLKDHGLLILRTPDLSAVAEAILQGRLEDIMHQSMVNGERVPVRVMDLIYGSHHFIEQGNGFMAHRTGFTARTLHRKLTDAGFEAVEVKKTPDVMELKCVGLKKADERLLFPLSNLYKKPVPTTV